MHRRSGGRENDFIWVTRGVPELMLLTVLSLFRTDTLSLLVKYWSKSNYVLLVFMDVLIHLLISTMLCMWVFWALMVISLNLSKLSLLFSLSPYCSSSWIFPTSKSDIILPTILLAGPSLKTSQNLLLLPVNLYSILSFNPIYSFLNAYNLSIIVWTIPSTKSSDSWTLFSPCFTSAPITSSNDLVDAPHFSWGRLYLHSLVEQMPEAMEQVWLTQKRWIWCPSAQRIGNCCYMSGENYVVLREW